MTAMMALRIGKVEMRAILAVAGALALGGAAVAQSPSLIEYYDPDKIRVIADSAGFKVTTYPMAQSMVQCNPAGPGAINSSLCVPEAFQLKGGGDLSFIIIPTDCAAPSDDGCGAIMLRSRVRLPKEMNVSDFLEVFNNTNSSVKVYRQEEGLVCDRYVQLAGGVTEAYLRQAIKTYAEVAMKLVEDKPR